MTPVEHHPLAEQELTAAALYYEERATGPGSDFLSEIERTEAFLAQFPVAGRILSGGNRRVSLRRFPYHLIFRIDGDRLFILAVAHHRRAPGYWQSRA
jgi:plasmid stabilization system protein ParE